MKLLQVPFLEMAMPGHVLTMDTFIPFILLVACVCMPYDVLKNWLVIQLECSDAAIFTNPRYFSNLSSWLMPIAHVFFGSR